MISPKLLSGLEDEVKRPYGAGVEPGAQNSIEWLQQRMGWCTASRFKDVLDMTKKGTPGAKRTAYLWETVYERLTGQVCGHFVNAAMQRGTELEPFARMAYEARTGAIVEQTGFRRHATIGYCGGSPDGVLEPAGGVEFKCPTNPQKHLECFLTGMDADEHMPQVQGLMAIHGAEWWDFASFHPDCPEPLNLYIQRIPRDAEYITSLEAEIGKFLLEVATLVSRLTS